MHSYCFPRRKSSFWERKPGSPVQPSLEKAADIFHCPTTGDVLRDPKFGKLKYAYLLVILAVCSIAIYEVFQITDDLLREELGTRASFRPITQLIKNPYFHSLVCPHNWVSRTNLEGLGMDGEMLRYFLGYLFAVEDGKHSIEAANISSKSISTVNGLVKKFGGIKQLMFAIMKNYTDNITDIRFGTSADGFMPCVEIPTFQQPDIIGDMQIDSKNNFHFFLNDSVSSEMYRFHAKRPYITHYHSEHQSFMNTIRLHFDNLDYSRMTIMVQLRQYTRYNGSRHHCVPLPNTPHEMVPLNFAKHICASTCWHTIFYNHYNCSFFGLVDPERAPTRIACNVLENNMIHQMGTEEIMSNEATECATVNRCEEVNFCSEWQISTDVQNMQETCIKDNTYQCEEFQMNMYVTGNVETLTEYPLRSLRNVVSDYGGQIGLWVGVSILSIAHLLLHKVWFWFYLRNGSIVVRNSSSETSATKFNRIIRSKAYGIETQRHSPCCSYRNDVRYNPGYLRTSISYCPGDVFL